MQSSSALLLLLQEAGAMGVACRLTAKNFWLEPEMSHCDPKDGPQRTTHKALSAATALGGQAPDEIVVLQTNCCGVSQKRGERAMNCVIT